MKLPGTGVLQEILGGGLRPAYPIYNQNLRFFLPYVYDLTKKFDTLFMSWTLNHYHVSDLPYNYIWIYENGAKELKSRPKRAFFSRQNRQKWQYKN